MAVDGPGDGGGGGLASEVAAPEEFSVCCVQGEEVTFTAAGEEEVRRCGEEAAVADVGGFVFPDALTR